jgi:hypothetical protein
MARRADRRSTARNGSRQRTRKGPRGRKRRSLLGQLWPNARTRARLWRSFRRAALPTKLFVSICVLLAVALLANLLYQVARKPSELFFPLSGTLYKTPAETWQAYGPLFRANATASISAPLLAALAQVEGSGNPIVRTYWRWNWNSQPFEIYRPASSAVGMYQFTDGTFEEAKHFCIHDHVVVEDGPWDHWHSCWFNRFYARVIPAHAVELVAAYLDRHVAQILERHRIRGASAAQKQDLAAVIHLCGAGAGDEFARRGFRLLPGQRCGDHEARVYVGRVNAMKAQFATLAAGA